MNEVIIKGIVLGLSTGVFCLGYCLPVVLPLVFAEKHPWKNRAGIIFKFCMGRMAAYLTVGGLAGYLGDVFLHNAFRRFMSIILVILSIFLILHGLHKGFPQFRLCCLLQKFFPNANLSFILGIFTGFNICPPFLIAVTYVFSLGKVFAGMLFFLIFFITTSFYLVPLVFAGYFSKFDKIRWVAQLSAIVAGVMFFLIGITQFAKTI